MGSRKIKLCSGLISRKKSAVCGQFFKILNLESFLIFFLFFCLGGGGGGGYSRVGTKT